MKLITILGLAFLVIILVFVLPRRIKEYDLTKRQETVTVKVVKLPDCTTGYKNKFIHISYNGRTFILRTKCKFVKSLVTGQQITMLHKPDTEIFLFPTENAKSELMTTILLAAFMTLCIGILTWKQRVTNQNAHNMGSRNFMSRITFIFGVAILLAFGCGSDRISKRIQPHDSDLASSSKQPNGAKYPLFIASDKDTFYSLGSNFPSGKGEYFEDIYLLTGQYKLDRLSYPCIEVRSIDNKRIVVYHFDSTSTNTFVYQKHDNYWLAKYFSKGDTCEFYTFKYLLPEREIEFNYTNKEATWFSDITVTDQNRETIYVPVKGFSISPELKNIDSLKNNYDYKHETILSGNTNQMKLRTLRTRKDGVKEIDNTECYPNPGKQHSLLWWELFAWTLLKRIDCH